MDRYLHLTYSQYAHKRLCNIVSMAIEDTRNGVHLEDKNIGQHLYIDFDINSNKDYYQIKFTSVLYIYQALEWMKLYYSACGPPITYDIQWNRLNGEIILSDNFKQHPSKFFTSVLGDFNVYLDF